MTKPMTAPEFVAELDAINAAALARLAEASAAGEPAAELSTAKLLRVALKNELEATEIAAIWLSSTAEIDVKLALARQVGDEAKHYGLIQDRLREMGVDADSINPVADGYSPLFHFLKSLTSTVERVAAGQFTREAIAVKRNLVFADFCEATGDDATARLYREVIQPDEEHHHKLGRRLLLRYAETFEAQDSARAAAARTLSLAEEIQEMARLKGGIMRAPGC